MCFFLTVAVPTCHIDKIAEVFGRGYQTFPTANRSVVEALPDDFSARLVTSGMCSCDLYARPQDLLDADPMARLRTKYEKLGWSTAKAERAIDQARTKFSQLPQRVTGVQLDVIEKLVTLCRETGNVALLVHWYSGDVETEHVPMPKSSHCDLNDFTKSAQELVADQFLFVNA